MEAVNLSAKIRDKIKKSLKWYSYPLVYFIVTGLVCAYAWYTRPAPYRSGIKVVFKTISVIPTLIWVGATILWTAAAILIVAIVYWVRNRYPALSIWTKTEIRTAPKAPASLRRRSLNVSVSALGVILIVAGLSLAIWISRPYVTLLLSTSKIEALENKAQYGQVQVLAVGLNAAREGRFKSRQF